MLKPIGSQKCSELFRTELQSFITHENVRDDLMSEKSTQYVSSLDSCGVSMLCTLGYLECTSTGTSYMCSSNGPEFM